MQNNAIFSHVYRMVNDLSIAEEIFAGLRMLKNKKAETISNKILVRVSFHTLAHIIKHIMVTSFNSQIQDIMITEDKLESQKYCCAQGYDRLNNMIGVRNGTAKRVKEKCPLAQENHCVCHTASLPCKAVFNNIPFMNNFQAQTFEHLNLIKKSSEREYVLEQYKKTATPD